MVEIDRAPTEDEALAITARYLPADEATQGVKDNLGAESLLVRMRPEKWLSTDYGKA